MGVSDSLRLCQWEGGRGGGASTEELERETVKKGEGESQTKVAGTDSVTALVTKIKLISGEERL